MRAAPLARRLVMPYRRPAPDRSDSGMRAPPRPPRYNAAPMDAPGRGCALALVAVFGTLAGCVELPVPTRTPYAAAPRSSSTPWSPPPAVTAQRPRTLAGRETRIDPQAVHGLAELMDFAHGTSPETQRAWEEARAAAAQAARAEAAYYPTLFALAAGGTSRVADHAPPPVGTFTVEGPGVNPRLQLNWILLDFGRRRSAVERGGQELLRANFAFNRSCRKSPSPCLAATSVSTRVAPGSRRRARRSNPQRPWRKRSPPVWNEAWPPGPISSSRGRSEPARHTRCRTRWVP